MLAHVLHSRERIRDVTNWVRNTISPRNNNNQLGTSLILSHPPCKWAGTEAIRGAKWKSYSFLLRRRVNVCYDTGRFLTVCLLFERFHWQNSNFQGAKISQKMLFWGLNSPPPPWYSALVFVGNETNATVSSFIPKTNYTQSMKKGFIWPFPILLKPALATFTLKPWHHHAFSLNGSFHIPHYISRFIEFA